MENQKRSLLVLFGGASSEHRVSCDSAASVIDHLDKGNYGIYTVGITRDGEWFLTGFSTAEIANGDWINNPGNKRAVVTPDASIHGLTVLPEDGSCRHLPVDVVFPVLHGKKGEDGSVQGLLELAEIPYVGAGSTASAACMDKAITKQIIDRIGVKEADFYLVGRSAFADDPQGVLKETEQYFGGKYPFFVKPAKAGSSVGISKAKNSRELLAALALAAKEDEKIIIEETISGRELEVAVLGNRRPKASVVGEILAANEFYDYDAKYLNEGSKTQIADGLSEEKEAEIRQAALTVYKAMGCKGLARVDFFLNQQNEVLLNEINTLPGFTQISMYPKLWEATGIPYGELLDILVKLALGEIE